MMVEQIEICREIEVDRSGRWDGQAFTYSISNHSSLVIIGQLGCLG